MKRINQLASVAAGMIAAGAVVGALPAPVRAQQASAQYACYIPGSGTMYRIRESNTPVRCSAGHEQFIIGVSAGVQPNGLLSSMAGAKGSSLPTNTAGAFDFSNANGILSVGTLGTGNIPMSGAGTRFMWYPAKAAVRAGYVNGTQWDDANAGHFSVAFGFNTRASGDFSAAIGHITIASGVASTALGYETRATGFASTASGISSWATGAASLAGGHQSLATGDGAVALGEQTTASGPNSIALGRKASTNNKIGAFVYGDVSSESNIAAVTSNQFVVRAQKFWFGTNNAPTATAGRLIETSTGAYLSSGGVWVSASDSTKKHHWQDVDGEAVLARLATLPVRTWSYRAEADVVRHMGPTAQDFRNAFGLGDSDNGIGSVDADGVSLAGIKALIERTNRLQRENDELRATLADVLERLTAIEAGRR